MSKLFDEISSDFAEKAADVTMPLGDYLDLCKKDSTVYASPAQRMLVAIGEPELVDTKNDPRLSKIFSNKVIKIYPAFKEFYGMEETIENIVAYFRHSAQGLEESKQILYLLGPVGGGKSSLAEKIKELMEKVPVWILDGSPVFENPLGLFNHMAGHAERIQKSYGLPPASMKTIPSPWALEKLKEFKGDISKFSVRKIYPSRLRQECISRIEPGDENNQDISTMVGELDISKIEQFSQNHPYAYSFSGGLNRANNGCCEVVEMFKAPPKMLNPLLTATQDRYYNGTKAIGGIPFEGIILAHSNESEWKEFKNKKTNEAFLDRVYLVKVPYCSRVTEEIQIYKKLIRHSEIREAVVAPGTLELLAKFCVMSRLIEPENSELYSKMRVYDGENIKNDDPKAKPLQEYKDAAGVDEGMEGLSTRFAYKVLSKTFNFDHEEIAANPIHLMYILKTTVASEQFVEQKEVDLLEMLDGVLSEKFLESLEKDIISSFLESFADLCQNVFETYFYYADAWVEDKGFRDPDTRVMLNREEINAELSRIEKPAGIDNPKDFRSDVAMFVIRYSAAHGGKLPRWDEFEKMRSVIEKKVLSNREEILPVISFTPKRSPDERRKHEEFVEKMVERGYTARQTKLLTDWYMRTRHST